MDMDLLHPYMDLNPLHLYMDPLHLLVSNNLEILQGVHAAQEGSTTSTTTHVALQTLGTICGPLHSTNFKYILPTLQEILEALLYFILKLFSLSQMGISRNFISFYGLKDIMN